MTKTTVRIEIAADSQIDATTDEAIRRLQQRSFPSTAEFRRSRYYVHRPRPDDAYVLAWDGDRLVGQAVLYWATGHAGGCAYKAACLGNVCCDPDDRGRGVAGRCVRETVDLARQDAADWMILLCGETAEGFYRKLGFARADGELEHTRIDGTTYVRRQGGLLMVMPISGEPWPGETMLLDIEDF